MAFDLDSPLLPGIVFVDTLRIFYGEIPVLLLSSRSVTEQRQRGYEINREEFVAKPFELDHLLRHVETLTA